MARENSGANFRVAVWLRMMLMSLVIATVNDRNDMIAEDDHDALGEVPAAVHRRKYLHSFERFLLEGD